MFCSHSATSVFTEKQDTWFQNSQFSTLHIKKKHSELSKHTLLLSQTTLVGAKDLRYSDRCAFQHRADCTFSSCWFPSDLIFRFAGIHQQLKTKAFQKLKFSTHHTIVHVQQNQKKHMGQAYHFSGRISLCRFLKSDWKTC